MNTVKNIIPITAALLLAGCISVLPEQKHAVPRYEVSLPDAHTASAAVSNKATSTTIFVSGRVRATDEASGRFLRTADLETGKTGILTDGELSRTPEAIVGSFLRNRLSARHPGAIVCDASIAPRSGAKTTTEAWIERFRLEKKDGTWSFVAHIRFFTESPDGTMTVLDATPAIPIPTENGARPTAADTVLAISKALASIEL
jgi:hypothetical protein